jgi:hypothetical protein
MAENSCPLPHDKNVLDKARTSPQQRSRFNDPFDITKIGLWILAIIVLAFTFDHAVSDVMYALGYERSKISNFWFLRNQYEYLTDFKHVSGLADSFHVFELFVWAMIPLNLARVAKRIVFLGYADDVRSPWNKNLSGGAYVFALFLFSSGCLAAPLFARDFSKAFFAPSPKVMIALEAWYFCICSLLLANAVIGFIQVNLGRSRHDKGQG